MEAKALGGWWLTIPQIWVCNWEREGENKIARDSEQQFHRWWEERWTDLYWDRKGRAIIRGKKLVTCRWVNFPNLSRGCLGQAFNFLFWDQIFSYARTGCWRIGQLAYLVTRPHWEKSHQLIFLFVQTWPPTRFLYPMLCTLAIWYKFRIILSEV